MITFYRVNFLILFKISLRLIVTLVMSLQTGIETILSIGINLLRYIPRECVYKVLNCTPGQG